MAYGLEAYKEDGSILFDTEHITYGLIKSATLTLYTRYGFWQLRSEGLDPSSESSWIHIQETNWQEPIVGVDVTGAVAPIFFLTGDGTPVGMVGTGVTRKYLFAKCSPNTKVYVFDVMRDRGEKSGFQCFDESGNLTFTGEQPPLNIVAVVNPPNLGPIISGSWNPPQPISGPVYVGGSTETSRPWSSSDAIWRKGVGVVSSGITGEIATHLTFSRAGWQTDSNYIYSSAEGCGGTTGGNVRFFFAQGVESTATFGTGNVGGNLWGGFPRDRIPQALVIQTSDYPFPFG